MIEIAAPFPPEQNIIEATLGSPVSSEVPGRERLSHGPPAALTGHMPHQNIT
jgi:hypothetical protein